MCVPYSVESLHRMAFELGIKKCWFHKNHYDIPQYMIEGVTKKCVVVSSKDIVKIIRDGVYTVNESW